MNLPILYVKQGCPWCVEALAYFKKQGIDLEIVDVRIHADKMADLQRISGQGMTPTLKNGDFIVADFDIGEFEEALRQNPEEAIKLGIRLD